MSRRRGGATASTARVWPMAATIASSSIPESARAVDHRAPVPNDGAHVRDRADLVHAVRHQHGADALLAGQPPHDGEQALAFAEGEVGGRLVEQEQPRARVEGAGDLDQLALVEVERSRGAVEDGGRQAGVDQGEGGGGGFVAPARAVESEGPALERQADVLGHREVRQERELLVHDRDGAACEGLRSPDPDGAGLRRQVAGDDADQGRLPGAVAAEEGVDLGLAHPEIGPPEHRRGAEALLDGERFEREGGAGHGRAVPASGCARRRRAASGAATLMAFPRLGRQRGLGPSNARSLHAEPRRKRENYTDW